MLSIASFRDNMRDLISEYLIPEYQSIDSIAFSEPNKQQICSNDAGGLHTTAFIHCSSLDSVHCMNCTLCYSHSYQQQTV